MRSFVVALLVLQAVLLVTHARVARKHKSHESLIDAAERLSSKSKAKHSEIPPGEFEIPKTDGKAKDTQTKENDQCVLCQYLIQRVRGEMLMNGIGGGIPYGQTPPLVGVPRFSAGGISTDVPNPATLYTPPVPGQAGAAPSFMEQAATLRKHKQRAAKPSFVEKWEDDGGYRKGHRRKIATIAKLHEKNLAYPKRERGLILRHYRPPQIRYADMYDGPLRAAQRAQERFENNQMNTVVYQVLEAICQNQVPRPFYTSCFDIIKNYQRVAEGLKFKDRADAICMHVDACTSESYIHKSVHSVYSS